MVSENKTNYSARVIQEFKVIKSINHIYEPFNEKTNIMDSA